MARLSAGEFQARVRAGTADDDVVVLKQAAGEVEADGDTRTARFVFSDGSIDRDNDTVDPAGWDLKSFRANPVILWAHQHRDLPVGRAVEVGVRGGRLVGAVEFATHPFAQTVLDLVRGGFLKATSVGFRALEWTRDEARGGINFKRQELLEVSICPVPANPAALVSASKSGIDTRLIREWAETVLKDGGREGAIEVEGDDDGLDVDDDLIDEARAARARRLLNPAATAGLIDVDPHELREAIREVAMQGIRTYARGVADEVKAALGQSSGRLD